MEVKVRHDKVIELCNTNNIDYIIDYLDYLLIQKGYVVNVIVNDYEYNINELKDYFILRNELVRERSNNYESRKLNKV